VIRAVPVQERAKKRYESILAAAKAHYAEVGRDRFNLDDVAAAAGCSVATIYRYFEDRLTLIEVAVPDQLQPEPLLEKILEISNSDLTPAAKWAEVEKILTAS
jgi:AcrR family transcriptional regulator